MQRGPILGYAGGGTAALTTFTIGDLAAVRRGGNLQIEVVTPCLENFFRIQSGSASVFLDQLGYCGSRSESDNVALPLRHASC